MESTSGVEVAQLPVARQPWAKWSKVLVVVALVVATVLAGSRFLFPGSGKHADSHVNFDMHEVVGLNGKVTHDMCVQCVEICCLQKKRIVLTDGQKMIQIGVMDGTTVA